MAFNWTLPIRVLQALFAIVVLGLSAYVADWYEDEARMSSPSEVNFIIFTSVWTLLALAFLIIAPWRFPSLANKFAIFGIEVLTMIFWFAAFIALAVLLDDSVCYGSVCQSAKAATVFGAFEWLLFAASCTLAALHVWRTRNTKDDRPPPEMQVHQGV